MDADALFPPNELNFIADRQWMDQRRLLQHKLKNRLGNCGNALREDWEKSPLPPLLAGMTFVQARVSQGDNYRGYPWMVLDYPARYSKEVIIAQRFFVLWGHALYFSWHLRGPLAVEIRKNFEKRWDYFGRLNYYLFRGTDEWEQRLDSEQFARVRGLEIEQVLEGSGDFKAGIRLDLDEMNQLEEHALGFSREFRSLLGT